MSLDLCLPMMIDCSHILYLLTIAIIYWPFKVLVAMVMYYSTGILINYL